MPNYPADLYYRNDSAIACPAWEARGLHAVSAFLPSSAGHSHRLSSVVGFDDPSQKPFTICPKSSQLVQIRRFARVRFQYHEPAGSLGICAAFVSA